MFLCRSKFYVFIFSDIDMPFTGRENVLCVLEYAQSQLNKTVQHAFVREFSNQSTTALHILTWHKKFKEKGSLCRIRRSGRPKTSEETVYRVRKKNLAKPKQIVTKNKSGNPDSTNNSLVHPMETLDDKALQATT